MGDERCICGHAASMHPVVAGGCRGVCGCRGLMNHEVRAQLASHIVRLQQMLREADARIARHEGRSRFEATPPIALPREEPPK